MKRRRGARVLLAFVSMFAVVASPMATGSAGAWADPFCFRPMSIQSRVSGRFVSAELSYGGSDYGMLRARATVVGPWEKFQLCQIPHTANQPAGLGLKSLANGRWVVDHRSYPSFRAGELTATAASLIAVSPPSASREQIWMQTTAATAFKAWGPGDEMLPQSAQRWISAELGDTGAYNGMLRARAAVKGPWEVFNVRFLG